MLAPLTALAALIPFAASAPSALPAIPELHAASSAQLSATAPWWERVVVTVGDEGETRACQYETSLEPGNRTPCDVDGAEPAKAAGVPEQLTRLTFERRFSPAASLADGEVEAGDSLLGKSVLALAIDGQGRVRGCKLVAAGGMKPDYGCAEATAEKFEASASSAPVATRVATLTILVYAHEENLV